MQTTNKCIKFRYVRDNRGLPRGVIAIDVNTNQIGWSYCCKKDTFKKSIAREIALVRLYKGSKVNKPREIVREINRIQDWFRNRRSVVIV